ncbi:Undecaprenyl-diphosphatase [Arthrobacter sp. 9V]|uniref:phosphatase PAP2 family protein n=1 Tax=Arthrobacter sp. 9V TaxID=2653132 RepID=UPI0012F0ADC3|nr:phosphatase PAP2 family protein [Arthrobacter sp. 9V]VXC57351.1 Undecaprenyl-diphosphatase [Arthrobacter sp. 9V]
MSGNRRSAGILRLLDRKLTVQERQIAPPTQRRLYVTALVLAMVGAGFFFLILAEIQQKIDIASVDAPVNSWFANQRSSAMTLIMGVLATIFGPVAMPIIVVTTTVVWMVRARHAWRPLLLAGAMLTGVILAQIISRLVARPRPPLDQMLLGGDSTYSFPSGHVLGASDFLLVGAFLVFSRHQHRIAAVIAGFSTAVAGILTQAVSRLYLGYHWLTDTLASISLSLVVLGAVIALDTWRTTRAAPTLDTKPSTGHP